MSTSLLVIGSGRMGKLVESLAPEAGFTIAGVVDLHNADRPETWPQADVAIDFSIAEAVPVNLPRLAARGINVVLGTTGHELENLGIREQLKAGLGLAPRAVIHMGASLAAGWFVPGRGTMQLFPGRLASANRPLEDGSPCDQSQPQCLRITLAPDGRALRIRNRCDQAYKGVVRVSCSGWAPDAAMEYRFSLGAKAEMAQESTGLANGTCYYRHRLCAKVESQGKHQPAALIPFLE